MFDELIGPTDAYDGGLDTGVGEVFEHGRAEAVGDGVLLKSADDRCGACEELEGPGIEGLDPARVDDGGGDAFVLQKASGFGGHRAEVTEAEDGDKVVTGWCVTDDFRLADLEEFGLCSGGRAGPGPARVTDGDGTRVVMVHRPEHVDELRFIFWRTEDEVGHVSEVADIEESVVCGAIVTREASTIHADGDVQVLQGDVMHDHVVSPLHEGGIDREEGFHAAGGHPCGEERGVFLGDTDIEVLGRMGFREVGEAGAGGHRSGDGDQAVVGFRELGEGFPEDLGVGGCGGWLGGSGDRFETTEAVEFVGLLESGRVAPPFLGQDVEDDGLVLGFVRVRRLTSWPSMGP